MHISPENQAYQNLGRAKYDQVHHLEREKASARVTKHEWCSVSQ
jgi:hypothetical protein